MAIPILHERVDDTVQPGDPLACHVALFATPERIHARKRDKIRFIRLRRQANRGFYVTFDPKINGKDKHYSNDATLNISLPNSVPDQGYYEYKIYYDKDDCCEVTPLDPIIIIDPTKMEFSLASSSNILLSLSIGALAGLIGALAVVNLS
ncbi:MAG: hypothetical protein ACI9MF_001078 [Gammaproteobacteria bacterium]|jgi:hypothetical protein